MLLNSRLRRKRTPNQYQGAPAMGSVQEGATFNSIGVTYPYDQAFNHYQKALVIYREVGDRDIARDIGDKVLVEAVLNNIQSLADTN